MRKQIAKNDDYYYYDSFDRFLMVDENKPVGLVNSEICDSTVSLGAHTHSSVSLYYVHVNHKHPSKNDKGPVNNILMNCDLASVGLHSRQPTSFQKYYLKKQTNMEAALDRKTQDVHSSSNTGTQLARSSGRL